MSLFEHEPMRAPGRDAQRLQPQQQVGAEARPLGRRDPQQIDRNALCRVAQQLQRIVDRGYRVGVAQYDKAALRVVVALGVDDTGLIACLSEALEQGCGDR